MDRSIILKNFDEFYFEEPTILISKKCDSEKVTNKVSWWSWLTFASEPTLNEPTLNESTAPTLNESLGHSIYEWFQSLTSRLVPAYHSDPSSGHLTTDEFVQAGNHLTQISSNWVWASSPIVKFPELPTTKQHLVNQGVTCHSRANFKIDEDQVGQDESWSCPVIRSDSQTEELHIYDLSITYDSATGTPRLWLLGYNENGSPLSMKQMVNDICPNYAGRTVTLISHPITTIPNISLHPCRHAEGMKSLINNTTDFSVDKYLTLFIHLVASAIPTIDLT